MNSEMEHIAHLLFESQFLLICAMTLLGIRGNSVEMEQADHECTMKRLYARTSTKQ